jgi:fatty-acyl-CoA synthase/long-chain acyl-CoA synthetase
MINGSFLWDKVGFSDMEWTNIGDQAVYTYRKIPASLYCSVAGRARKFPGKTAVVTDNGTRYSYGRLISMTDEFAAFLSEKYSIGRGGKAAILFFSGIEYCIALLALNRLGASTVLFPNKYTRSELTDLAGKISIELIICENVFQDWFRQTGIPVLAAKEDSSGYGFAGLTCGAVKPVPRGRAENGAVILFTSGTTAGGKTVELKNFNIMHAIVSYQRILNITEKDSSVIPIPIYTVTGTIAVLGLMLHAGGVVFLHRKFDAGRVLLCAIENKLTYIHAAPTVFSMLLEYRETYPAIPGIRVLACGSSNMPAENIRRLHEWLPGAAFQTVYGLTETSSPATIFPSDAAESPYIGSSGIPIPGVMIKIIDDDESETETGGTGEVALRGSVVIRKYFHGGEDSFTRDRWLKTGDLGYLNEEGYLYIVDRKKDIINRGGEKICSFDVENAIHGIDGIIEAAVVGIPHPKYGEQPAAVVRLEKGYTITEREIKARLSSVLANFMIPAQIRFVEEIIKTSNGKIDKKALRLWFQNEKKPFDV